MWQPSLISLSIGLLTVAILHANNTRDILNDSRAGIHTLCIALGGRASQWVYAAENAVAYLLVPAFIIGGLLPWTSMLAWITLPLAWSNVRTMLQAEPLTEQPIAMLDQRTAQTQMAFGLMLTFSLLLAVWIR